MPWLIGPGIEKNGDVEFVRQQHELRILGIVQFELQILRSNCFRDGFLRFRLAGCPDPQPFGFPIRSDTYRIAFTFCPSARDLRILFCDDQLKFLLLLFLFFRLLPLNCFEDDFRQFYSASATLAICKCRPFNFSTTTAYTLLAISTLFSGTVTIAYPETTLRTAANSSGLTTRG